MNIQYLAYKEIDKVKWDACVEKAKNHLTYGYSWYLDIIAEQWDGLVLDDYQAVMPLCYNKKLLGYSQLYQPAFNQQAGIFSIQSLSETDVKSFLQSIPEKFKLINISLNEKNPIVPFGPFTVYRKTNLVTPLHKSYQEIANAYSDNHKRNVAKSKRRGLRIESSDKVKAVIKMYQETQKDKAGLSNEDYKRIEILMQKLLEKEMAFIKEVYLEDELILSMFFIHDQNRIINIFGSGNEKGKKNKAMYFCIDHILEAFAGTETIFDFEGSSIPGVAYFFKGFGCEKKFYHQIVSNQLPNWLSTLRSIRTWIKS